ncbi:hypothetical protein [Pseudomonas panipatensis]|uniref:hypothetical protein n=1 Tax=Pseudomonas panipatensis TaxID=428992 RepID=UPI0035B30D02
MRTISLLLTALLLAGNAFSSELIFPSLLPGASGFDIKNTPLPVLLKKEWDHGDWVQVVKDSQDPIRYVKSCSELDEAHQNGEYSPSSAGMSVERQQMEYCQNIRRLILAKPARKSELPFPLCLDKALYLALIVTLKSPWGSDGLLRIKGKFCRTDSTEAIVSYDRIIEPENEIGGGQTDGVVNIRYLVQGDFDHDGWLDLITEVYMEPDFSKGNWFQSESGVSGVVKISRVKGKLTVTKFEDL